MVLINLVFKSSQQQLSKSLSGLINNVLDKLILAVTFGVFLRAPCSCRLAEVKCFYISGIAVPTLEKGYGGLFLIMRILRAENGEIISELEEQMRC